MSEPTGESSCSSYDCVQRMLDREVQVLMLVLFGVALSFPSLSLFPVRVEILTLLLVLEVCHSVFYFAAHR